MLLVELEVLANKASNKNDLEEPEPELSAVLSFVPVGGWWRELLLLLIVLGLSLAALTPIPNPGGIRLQLDVQLVGVVLDDPHIVDLVDGHHADDKDLQDAVVDVGVEADDRGDEQEDHHPDLHPVTELCRVVTLN